MTALHRTLAFVTLMAVSVFGTSTGAQDGMFSTGDAYERFMGRWSRELAPLLVNFRRGSRRQRGPGRRIGDGRTDGGCRRGRPVQSDHRIDPAAPYVAFAQARHPLDFVRFEVGDAERLRFLDRSFDRTLSLLGPKSEFSGQSAPGV